MKPPMGADKKQLSAISYQLSAKTSSHLQVQAEG